MSVEKISISIPSDMKKEIEARGPRSTVIGRDLGRLYTLYRRALAQIKFTVDEGCLIVDVLNGLLVDTNSPHLLWAEIEDAIKLNRVDQKWNVDGEALVVKLRTLNEIQCMAVIDAVERYWNGNYQVEGDIREQVKIFLEGAIE